MQKRSLALRHEAAQATAADAADAATYENVWALHNNAMRFMPNFFEKGQLSKIFICFPDPHFKRKNHRKRIISQPLLAEFGYTLSAGGHLYAITDVAELTDWMTQHVTEFPLYERVPNEDLVDDVVVPALLGT